MMRQYLLLSFLVIWSSQLWADSIALNPDNDLAVSAVTNTSFPLNIVETTKAPTEASPARIYIPMDGPDNQASYFIEKGVTALFTASSGSYYINYPLYINVSSTDKWLYAAVKNESSSDYKVAKRYSATPFNGVTNSNITFPISTQEICLQYGGCSDFASSTTSTEEKAMVYFFFSTNSAIAISSVITPASSNPGGIFFESYMSNYILNSTQLLPQITQIRPGDKRIIVDYTSTTSITNPKAVRIFVHDNPGSPSEDPIQDYYAADANAYLYTTQFSYAYSGSVTVNDLTNGTDYEVSVLFENLYKFGTVLSLPVTGQPKEIQELLKENACFLLTAGFGENHYIIDYFRHFRDNVLSHSYLGRVFIHTYYELAPKYALMIYEHEGIRAAIRGMAYTLYFVFNYILPISLVLVAICVGFIYRKRLKNRQA